jgi:fatty acid CoA ligase FadD32
VAAGYFRDPERTATTFDATLGDGSPGSFLRTGDLGFLRDGQLFVTGRLTEMIIVRGRNYHAEDIEESARNADPALQGTARSAAFACERDAGEVLVVVQEVRREAVQTLTAERVADLALRIRSAVGDEHGIQPADVVLLPPGGIPCTTSGKVRRGECRASYESGQLPALVLRG